MLTKLKEIRDSVTRFATRLFRPHRMVYGGLSVVYGSSLVVYFDKSLLTAAAALAYAILAAQDH